MKKLYKLVLFLTVIILMPSCDEVFDFHSDGRLSYKDIFSDNNMTISYLNTAYTYMPSLGHSYQASNFLGAYTDEAHDSKDVDNSDVMSYYIGGATSQNNRINNSFYNDMYMGIRKCNVFLENIDDAILYDETNRSKWRGEAYVLRAFYYLQLIKRFGPVYIIKKESRDYDVSDFVRPTFYENVQAILDDCNAAIAEESLPWRVSDENERGAMSKSVAMAIKSQAILFAASPLWDDGEDHWDEALRITKNVLDTLRAQNFELYDPSFSPIRAAGNYQRFFLVKPEMVENPGTDKETIYAHKGQLNIWQQHGLPFIANTIKAGSCPSQELVDAYETSDGKPVLNLENPYLDDDHLIPNYNPDNTLYDPENPYANRDKRLASTIFHNESPYNLWNNSNPVYTYVGGNAGISTTDNKFTRTGYYVRKWHDYTSMDNANKDGYWRYFRFAEMILNYAEAEFYANGVTNEALNAVNEIRNRAELPDFPAGISADEFELRLRNERRVEFAFEEHRYFDVRRWNIHEQTDGVVTGMKITQTSSNNYDYERIVVSQRDAYKSKYKVWPIPYSESTKFSMQGVEYQNPGWK